MGEAREKQLAIDVGRLEAERDRLRHHKEIAMDEIIRLRAANRAMRDLQFGPEMLAALLVTLGKTEATISRQTMQGVYGKQITIQTEWDRSVKIALEDKPTNFTPRAVLGEKAAGATVEMEPR